MNSADDRFYEKYVSTHLTPRKGNATLEEFRVRSGVYQRQLGAFVPAARDARILDGGCGNGSVVWWLRERGYQNVEGVDISAEQIEVAESLGVTGVRCADLRDYLSVSPKAYDAIILRDVLEHVAKEEVMSVLEACRNALKQGGTLILQVPNAESPFFGRVRYGDFTHQSAFCVSSLSQVLHMAGLSHVRFRPVRPAASDLKSLVRLLLWLPIEWVLRAILLVESGKGTKIVTQNIVAAATK